MHRPTGILIVADESDSKKQGHLVPLGYARRFPHAQDNADGRSGQLKAKLSKLKRELLTPSTGGGGGGGAGFDVARTGVASVYGIRIHRLIQTQRLTRTVVSSASRPSERVP
jgi:hypothetical protein